jgi:hypothetical protein
VPRSSPLACLAAIGLLPVAAACAFWYAASALPFSIAEEATVRRPDALPPVASAVARALGTGAGAWRALGAFDLAALGIAAGTLAWRWSRSRLVACLAGALAPTHALALLSAVDARGSLALLAVAAFVGAVGACGRRWWCHAAAVLLILLGALAWPRPVELPPPDGLARLGLNRAQGTAQAGLAPSVLALGLIIFGLAKSSRSLQARLVVCGGAIAFAAMGLGTASQEVARDRPARFEIQRFLARLDAFPPVPTGAEEVVLDAPLGNLPRPPLCDARPARHLAFGIEATADAARLRILHWSPPRKEGGLGMLPCELSCVIDAAVDPSIVLMAPAADVSLQARSARDEPEFRFALPGPVHDLHELRLILISQGSEGTRVEVRELEDATVRRDGAPDAPVLAWRPGWRPMAHAERELRWEDGDVCPRGGTLWWTVAILDEDGPRMAPLRRLFVQP